jgi:hypothetical protein
MVGLKLFVMLVFAAMSLVHDIAPWAIAVISAAMPMGPTSIWSRRAMTLTSSALPPPLLSIVCSVLTMPLLALVLAEAPIVRLLRSPGWPGPAC